MNRRSFFKALLATPVVAVLAPLVPKPTRVSLAGRMETALSLFWNRPPLVSRQTLFDSVFTHKEDISEMLFAELARDQTLTVARGMSMGEPPRSLWIEDSDNVSCDA